MEQQILTAVLTACITVFVGIVVFSLQQIIEKFYIAPLSEYRRVVADVAYNLIYYANIYMNPGTGNTDTQIRASEKLREIASKLIATNYMVNGYWIFRLFHQIPSHRQVNEAANLLIMLSNSPFRGDIQQIETWSKKVSKLLGLRTFEN